MHRIDDPTAVPTLPAPRAQGTPGYFTGGSPGSSGFAATIVRYEWLNSHQEELAHVVETAGLTLDKTDNTQLLQALNKLYVSRTLVTADMVIYVNPTTGNDSNNGLTSGTAFKTIQAAINAVYRSYDWNGHSCTIQLADGTYTVTTANAWAAYFAGMPFGMPIFGLTLKGNSGSRQNVQIVATNGGCVCADNANLNVDGLSVNGQGTVWTVTTTPGMGLAALRNGWMNATNVRMDVTGGMFGARADWGGMVNLMSGSTPVITGSGQYGIFSGIGGTIWGANSSWTVAGWSAVQPLFFADQGRIEIGASTFSGAATGTKYGALANGVINTSGGGPGYLPGSVAGSVASGGQYI